MLAVLMAGNWRAQSWAEPARPAGLDDLKGVLEALASRLHLGPLGYQPREARPGIEHPGRTAAITSGTQTGDEIVGLVFEVDPRLLAAYEVRAERVAFAILEMEQMRAAVVEQIPQVGRIDHLPAVERDVAVIVGKRVAAGDVAKRSATVRARTGRPRLVRPLPGPTACGRRDQPRLPPSLPATRCADVRS